MSEAVASTTQPSSSEVGGLLNYLKKIEERAYQEGLAKGLERKAFQMGYTKGLHCATTTSTNASENDNCTQNSHINSDLPM